MNIQEINNVFADFKDVLEFNCVLKNSNTLIITEFTVHEAHRNNGIGTGVINELKRLAVKNKFNIEISYARSELVYNEFDLLDWYKKLGFIVTFDTNVLYFNFDYNVTDTLELQS